MPNKYTLLRNGLILVILFGLALAACAPKTAGGFTCPAPSPKLTVESKELNLLVWTEYVPPDIIECFERVYNLKVNRSEYDSLEQMFDMLSSGSAAYDLAQPTDYVVSQMIKAGQLQKLDKSRLPVMSNFNPTYLGFAFDPSNDYTLPYQAGTNAIVVNTDKVKNIPKSWADLWKPEYAGQMIFLDDSRAVIGMALLTLGYDVNTQDPAQLEAARQQLKTLTPNIKVFDSDSPKDRLIAGEANLGMTWTGEALLAQRAVPSIQYIYPAEGAILWQDNYALLAEAPHLDAAYAWLNYSLQGDVFWLMLRDFPYTNPNQAALDYAKSDSTTKIKDKDGNEVTPATLYQAYIESPITNTPPEAIKNGHRIDDAGDAAALYDQIWTEIRNEK